MKPILLRSLLFCPADETRKVARLAGAGADGVVLDLEDAVAAGAKTAARNAVRGALAGLSGMFRAVRVNGLDTGLTAADVAASVAPGLDAIVLPKVETPGEIGRLDGLLGDAEEAAGIGRGTVKVIALIETAAGIGNAGEIARAGGRMLTLALGSADLATDLGLPVLRSDGGAALAYGRAKLVYDARAAGLMAPIDGPFLAVRDGTGLAADCATSRALGHGGRICIHPDQVAVANRAYAPDADEVAFARQVVAAFAEAGGAGSAAIAVDGVFVDPPVARKAERVVALADAIAAKEGG